MTAMIAAHGDQFPTELTQVPQPSVEEIENDPKLAAVPVIFLTGKDRNDDMGRSFKVGGDMFIKKPFSCERLLEIVNSVIMSSGKH